jgi:dTDP-4-amino-4,6-dideoxygalactose transaminase
MIKIPRTIVFFPLSSLSVALKTISTGRINKGKYIGEFEEAFRKLIGVNYATSVSCGKIGLYLSLKAMGAKEGEEVILPAYTVWDVPAVIIALGLKPVFVDISPEDYNMDIKLMRNAITKKTKFILATHIYGYPCDIDPILQIAKEYNLRLIEDCAQSLGARYKGKMVGSFGELAYFSFGFFKNLNTLGGGMVVTNNPSMAQAVKKETETFPYPKISYAIKGLFTAGFLALCTHPVFFSTFIYPLIYCFARPINKITSKILSGNPPLKISKKFLDKYKFKYTNLQAAIGLDQIKTLSGFNNMRIKNVSIIEDILQATGGITIPKAKDCTRPIYLNYVVQVPEYKRGGIIAKLLSRGVDSSFGFLNNCAGMPEFEKFKAECPVSKKIQRTNLYIPVQPPLNQRHMGYIAELIKEALAGC